MLMSNRPQPCSPPFKGNQQRKISILPVRNQPKGDCISKCHDSDFTSPSQVATSTWQVAGSPVNASLWPPDDSTVVTTPKELPATPVYEPPGVINVSPNSSIWVTPGRMNSSAGGDQLDSVLDRSISHDLHQVQPQACAKKYQQRKISILPVRNQPKGDWISKCHDSDFTSPSQVATSTWQAVGAPVNASSWPPDATKELPATPVCDPPGGIDVSPTSSTWVTLELMNSNAGGDQLNLMLDRSISHDLHQMAKGTSSSKMQKMQKFETPYVTNQSVVQNLVAMQRNEIKSLVAELKARDKELNDIFSANYEQMLTWQQDKQKLLAVERKCFELEAKLTERDHTLFNMQQQLDARVSYSDMIRKQMEKIKHEKKQQSKQMSNLGELNKSLKNSMLAVSEQLGQLEAKEQELITLLSLKDRELTVKCKTIDEFHVKIKELEIRCQESQRIEASALHNATLLKGKYMAAQKTIEDFTSVAKMKEAEAKEHFAMLMELKSYLMSVKVPEVISDKEEECKNYLVYCKHSKNEKMLEELRALSKEESVCSSSSTSITSLMRKLENFNCHCTVSENQETDTMSNDDEWKERYLQAVDIMESLSNEINQKRIENEKNAAIIAEIQQQVAAMQDTFHKACDISEEFSIGLQLREIPGKEMGFTNLNVPGENLQANQLNGNPASDPQYRNLADVRAEDITHLSNGISFEKKLAYFLDSSVGMEKVDVSHKEYEVNTPKMDSPRQDPTDTLEFSVSSINSMSSL